MVNTKFWQYIWLQNWNDGHSGLRFHEVSTFSGTTILSNLFSSSVTFSFKANGTVLGLKNCGATFSLSFKWAVPPFIVPRPPSHRAGNAYFETTFSTLAHGSTHYDFLFQLISKNKIWKALLRFFCCGSLKKNYIKVTAKPPRNL